MSGPYSALLAHPLFTHLLEHADSTTPAQLTAALSGLKEVAEREGSHENAKAAVKIWFEGTALESFVETAYEQAASKSVPFVELMEQYHLPKKLFKKGEGTDLVAWHEQETSQTTPEIAYIVPIERFVYMIGGRYELNKPVGIAGAQNHLTAQGMKAAAADKLIKRRNYLKVYGIDTAPSQAHVYTDPTENQLYLNRYVPSSIVPAQGSYPTIQLLLNHIANHEPAGVEYLTHWMASKVQNPGARSHNAIVVYSPHTGGGKSMLGNVLAEILGKANCAEIGQVQLESQFSDSYATKLFVIGNEIANNAGTQRDISNQLKSLICDTTVNVNTKGVKAYSVQNRTSWWLTSNGLPVHMEGEDDRHYSIFRPPAHTPAHVAALKACYQVTTDGTTFTPAFLQEIAAFAYDLIHLQVNKALISSPYAGEARKAVAEASATGFDSFWHEIKTVGVVALVEAAAVQFQNHEPFKTNPWTDRAAFIKDHGNGKVEIEKGHFFQLYKQFAHNGSFGVTNINKLSSQMKKEGIKDYRDSTPNRRSWWVLENMPLTQAAATGATATGIQTPVGDPAEKIFNEN